MPVQGEHPADVAPAHQREADMVDEAHRAPSRRDEGGDRLGVETRVDPFDREHGEQLVAKRMYGLEPEASLGQRGRLDEDVVVGE